MMIGRGATIEAGVCLEAGTRLDPDVRVSQLSLEEIEAVDPSGMLEAILAQPTHYLDALKRMASAVVPPLEAPGGLVVCGMGGSAIGADLAAAAATDRLRRPLCVVRDYAIEPWIGPETLLLCSSYSGNTEETLAAFEAAGAAGATRIVLTTGGRLEAAARAERVPVLLVPAGLQPRAAVAYMTVGALHCAALGGGAPDLSVELEAATSVLAELVHEWGPDAPGDSLAKELARTLHGCMTVVYGAGVTAPGARGWKAQLNENAKVPAFNGTLPEANHNEICAWEKPGQFAVFLEDPSQHPRVQARIELMARIVAEAGAGVPDARQDHRAPQARSLARAARGMTSAVGR